MVQLTRKTSKKKENQTLWNPVSGRWNVSSAKNKIIKELNSEIEKFKNEEDYNIFIPDDMNLEDLDSSIVDLLKPFIKEKQEKLSKQQEKEEKLEDKKERLLKNLELVIPGAEYYIVPIAPSLKKFYKTKSLVILHFSIKIGNKEYRDFRSDLEKNSLHELDLILEYLGSSDDSPKELYKYDDDYMFDHKFQPSLEYRNAIINKITKIINIIHNGL